MNIDIDMEMLSKIEEGITNAIPKERDMNVVTVNIEQEKQVTMNDKVHLKNKQSENEDKKANSYPSSESLTNLSPTPDNLSLTPDNLSQTPPNLSTTPDNLSLTLNNLSPTPDNLPPTPYNLPPNTDNLSPTPDYFSPTLIVIILNMFLPTTDLLRDLAMLLRLSYYPQHWSWGIYLFAGVLLNFLFTCWAWWRLEDRLEKRKTWLLLLLQVTVLMF